MVFAVPGTVLGAGRGIFALQRQEILFRQQILLRQQKNFRICAEPGKGMTCLCAGISVPANLRNSFSCVSGTGTNRKRKGSSL